ncbi:MULTISPECIES: aldo/keto reductase [unclassified Enterococcus]|uniref:aldo/keto reductase n=1 Tax=unclassified Enterococcus TaxID=2608891 RepID=UPI001CE072BC|nr:MULTISPECIES: aldo/keto reductase [unclassified Enterococcus]MCA5013591.1 aldo/keto reductase [Enterococcus sp. S23]MCA5016841.1 aldo/keto reductase [Enterococcus sp. S22(2020)]
MIHSLTDTVLLNNGVKMPGFGLGVFQVSNEDTIFSVQKAIEAGYISIDTAQIYGNEEGVGEGIRRGLATTGKKREDLFITTKIWNHQLDYDQTITAFNESLLKLGLDYVDLYLIHWPGNNEYLTSWKAMEELYTAGKIKAIGVSNFEIHHLETLLETAKVTPVLNQVELHPRMAQKEMRSFLQEKGIAIEAWSPLMQGQLLQEPTILTLAEKYHKSAAQIILRWHVQNEIIVIPKSIKEERIASNADLFDFELSTEDLALIDQLDNGTRVGPHPDTFFFE